MNRLVKLHMHRSIWVDKFLILTKYVYIYIYLLYIYTVKYLYCIRVDLQVYHKFTNPNKAEWFECRFEKL